MRSAYSDRAPGSNFGNSRIARHPLASATTQMRTLREREVGTMKWIGLILVLVLLGASQATSQVSDDNLIVPGQRIGKWRLEMTIRDLVQMNGQATTNETLILLDIVPPPPQRHNWGPPLNFAAITRDGQRVEFFLIFSPAFKTEKGVGPGSNRVAVQSAYGPPTAETRAGVTTRMIYDAIGFAANMEGDRVTGSNVFRPGTGKSIWKL